MLSNLKIVQLEKCCCCLGLRTGVLVLGWISLIQGVIGAIVNIITVYSEKYITLPPDLENKEYYESLLKYVTYFAIGQSFIVIFINIGLIWGVMKSRSMMLIPWLLTGLLSLILFMIIIFGGSIMFVINKSYIKGSVILIIGLLSMVLQTYIWLCVYSHYRNIKLEEQQKLRSDNDEIRL